MRTPVAILAWEIFRRNRLFVGLVIGLVIGWAAFVHLAPDGFRATEAARERLAFLNWLILVFAVLLGFCIFHYTESSAGRDWQGFPARQFTLPVTTLALVAVPMLSGLVSVELIYLACTKLFFAEGKVPHLLWFATLIGTALVLFQTVIWSLSGVRITRIVVLSLTGFGLFTIGFMPFVSAAIPTFPRWFSEKGLIPALLAVDVCAFLATWRVMARQRSGGGRRIKWWRIAVDRAMDLLPRRRAEFRSVAGAQLWFEWRRIGWLLPACVAFVLLTIVTPISWFTREDHEATLWLLFWTLITTPILTGFVSKGFTGPNLWSSDPMLPPFLAARPISCGELVIARLRVAALTVGISWGLVIVFLAVWLFGWADTSDLNFLRLAYWMVYDHSVWAQYAIAVLFIGAAMLFTWALLACGLWLGLCGNRRLQIGVTVAQILVGFGALIGFIVLLNQGDGVGKAFHKNADRYLAMAGWGFAVIMCLRMWLAVFLWQGISARRVRNYLWLWSAVTLGLVALVLLLWAHGLLSLALMNVLGSTPLDPYRLRNVLLLFALTVVPLARIGLARLALMRNRHR